MGAADHRTFLNIIVKSRKQIFVTIIQLTVKDDGIDIQKVDAVDDPACEILRYEFQNVLSIVLSGTGIIHHFFVRIKTETLLQSGE